MCLRFPWGRGLPAGTTKRTVLFAGVMTPVAVVVLRAVLKYRKQRLNSPVATPLKWVRMSLKKGPPALSPPGKHHARAAKNTAVPELSWLTRIPLPKVPLSLPGIWRRLEILLLNSI